ncbi:hypothetical protein GGH93_002856 [Coemansia aciculifera]|nr:hypothetical protein GGH93_002856 [Coemansia aciculifera]
MPALSIFQLLPPHVVELIVRHVVGSSRLQFDGIKPNSIEYKCLLVPLLSVCPNFHDIAFSLSCNDYRLHLCVHSDKITIEESSWGTFIDCLDFSFHFLCREIRIKVDAPTILEGKALKLLSTAPYNGCAFHWARKLIVDIVTDRSYDEDDGRLPPDAYDNVLTFARRIKEMAPRVSEVSLDIGDADGNLTTIIGKHTCFLLLNLSTIARKTLFTNGCKQLVACPDLALVCKLSCIDCNIDEDSSGVLQLARLNALTLQTINIWSYYEVDISGLIRDDDNDENYVVYPYLRTLEIYVAHVPAISQRLTFKGAVPFPSLWNLILRSYYPLGDDVVFRDNGATLEYLKVALHPELVAILERHSVFTRTSHPQLKCVDTGLFSSHTLRPFATAAAYLRFVMGIAPGSPVRVVDYRFESGRALLPALFLLKDYVSIQVLALPRVRLSFWGAVSLIKLLPLLSDLHTRAPIHDGVPQGVADADLPEYVRSTYAPMGRRFRCWHIAYHSIYDNVDLVTSILLLALICPNFDYAAVYKDDRESFMKEMRKQIADPRFSEYAPRLSRLLYNGWKE